MIGNITKGKNFQGTTQYILEKDGARLLLSNVPGALTQPPNVIARAMEQTAALNDTITKPVYHLSVSPAETETLTKREWSEFGYRLLEEMGVEHHQFFIALHDDTTYPQSGNPRIHAHLLVNLIDNKGQFTNPCNDYLKLQKALRQLEQEFELDSPFLAHMPSESPIKPDTRGQQQRYERELKDYQNPQHPRSQPPEKSHRQQLQAIINDALEANPDWTTFQQSLLNSEVSINRSKRGWSVDFQGSHFAGYQLGKQYTLPSILETLRVAQPDNRNPSTAVQEPMVQSPSQGGLGNVLAETALAESDIIDAEVVKSRQKIQPKEVVTAIADGIHRVDQYGRHKGVSAAIEEQSDDQLVDGAFLLGQLGKAAATVIKVGAELIPERNGSNLTDMPTTTIGSKPSTSQDVDNESNINGEVIEAVIVEPDSPQPSPDSTQSDIDPEPNDQRLAHNLSSFIKVWTKANKWPIDTPFKTVSGDTVQLSGDRLTLSNSEATQTEIGTNNKWISGPQQFEATRNSDGMWDVSINSLDKDAQERIAQIPTTPEEYQDYQNATVVVDHIRQQAQAADIPLNELTEFEWKANEFNHQFTLEPDSNNGSIHITGKDSENNDIFDVTLRADNTLAVHQSNIDGEQIEQLKRLSQESERPVQHNEPTQQLERTTSKGPQR